MLNKYLSLFIIILLLTGCTANQELKELFRADISNLLSAYNNSEWEKAADMLYPKFFLAVRRSQVIETWKHLDSAGMTRRFKLKDIDKISEILSAGNEDFCRAYYSVEIEITLNPLQYGNLEHFIEDFNEDYGKENVLYNEAEHQFIINAQQSVIAVSLKGSGVWKYLELNNEHAFDTVAQVVPKEIMEKLIN